MSVRRRGHRFSVRNIGEPCIERKQAWAERTRHSLPSSVVQHVDVCNPVAVIEIHKHEIGFAVAIEIDEEIDPGRQTLNTSSRSDPQQYEASSIGSP